MLLRSLTEGSILIVTLSREGYGPTAVGFVILESDSGQGRGAGLMFLDCRVKPEAGNERRRKRRGGARLDYKKTGRSHATGLRSAPAPLPTFPFLGVRRRFPAKNL